MDTRTIAVRVPVWVAERIEAARRRHGERSASAVVRRWLRVPDDGAPPTPGGIEQVDAMIDAAMGV